MSKSIQLSNITSLIINTGDSVTSVNHTIPQITQGNTYKHIANRKINHCSTRSMNYPSHDNQHFEDS